MAELKYKRVLLKLSGEALAGEKQIGIDPHTVSKICAEIADVVDMGLEVALVIGGGNIFRGLSASAEGMDRSSADYMGMLATVLNALAVQDALEKTGHPTRVLSAIAMQEVCEPYVRRRAMRHLEKGRVIICAAGTGNPYFTTDTAAALRGMELKCDAIIKATKVDGVYDKDPMKHDDAVMFKHLSYEETLRRHLKVMDSTAITLAQENQVPIIVQRQHQKGGHGREPRHHRRRRLSVMDKESVLLDSEDRMDKALGALDRDFSRLRTGRASTGLVDNIKVDYYGTPTPISQLASVAIPDSRTITIQPWDRGAFASVEKAILKSDLGLTPVNDGRIIRINIPPLTEERRKELVKVARKYTEDAKVAVRNVRRDANDSLKKLEKEKTITEDEQKKAEAEVQKLTDKFVADADKRSQAKEKEIMDI